MGHNAPMKCHQREDPVVQIASGDTCITVVLPFKKKMESNKRVIVVLMQSYLETVKAGKTMALLNCDDHQNILRKHNRNIAEARPDITHQVLDLSLLTC
jgi:rRNA small subunit pseudouridine methyltransferase Nep1